jgi:hypothetical protein
LGLRGQYQNLIEKKRKGAVNQLRDLIANGMWSGIV